MVLLNFLFYLMSIPFLLFNRDFWISLINFNKILSNNRGTFVASTADALITASVIGGAAGLGGAAIAASANGGAPGIEDNYVQGPGFQTQQSNENLWANQLSTMAGEPDYGAIQPDWNDIWNQTQQQVQNYFSGTATQPGVNDQISASFAQRGMSGDPAASYLQAASGANEAQDLGNLSAQQNIAQNQFGLEGQQQWLNAMNQFQASPGVNQAAGNWTGGVAYATPAQQIGNAISGIGTGVTTGATNALSSNAQMAYLQNILNPTSTGGYSLQYGSGVTPVSNTAPYTAPNFS